jgi:hypothetical protein
MEVPRALPVGSLKPPHQGESPQVTELRNRVLYLEEEKEPIGGKI